MLSGTPDLPSGNFVPFDELRTTATDRDRDRLYVKKGQRSTQTTLDGIVALAGIREVSVMLYLLIPI